MNIQIIGHKKCQESNKAERFFKERGIKYQYVDLKERALSLGEIENIKRSIPLEQLIDANSKLYNERGLKYKVFDILEEILENPMLISTPIVRNGKVSSLGYVPEQWKKWLD